MAGTGLLTVGSVWAMTSGLVVALLGALCLIGGRSRPRGALAFGFFGVVWGLQITFGNSTNFATTAASATLLYGLFLVFLIPLPYLLLEFAWSQAEHERKDLWLVARIAGAATSILAATLFLVQPHWFYNNIHVAADNGIYVPTWGPLYAPLVIFPFYGAFGLAFLALVLALRGSPTPRTQARAKVLLIGLGLFLAPLAGKYTVLFGGDYLLRTGDLTSAFYVLIFGALLVLSLWASLGALAASRKARTDPERRAHRQVAWALLVPLAFGIVEGLANLFVSEDLFTVGLWRLAAVGVVVYGLAQWRFYDLPQRAGRLSATAGGAATAAVGGVAAYGAVSLSTEGPVVPTVFGLMVALLSLIPAIRFSRRIFTREPPVGRSAENDSVYGQRIDAYRAALEASYARDSLEEDAEFLAALRERFGISDAEDRVLRHYAKSSVVVARDRKASEAFERLRLLGEGGGGRTWLARDRQRDRLVVLKEPLQQWQQDPQTREAVLREARLAAKVRHPNVVAVEEVVEGKGSPIIVMEYLEGGSLSDLLRAKGTLPWREAVPLAMDVARGVEAIHAAGIVHRDVKPSNILLNGEGVPKVADFGIALPVVSTRTVLDVGSTARAGTVFYMAPEVRAGMSAGDRRADVYACAAVLHECLYGAPPGAHAPVIIRSDVPAALTALLANALAERPEDRVPTARAFAEELARVLRG